VNFAAIVFVAIVPGLTELVAVGAVKTREGAEGTVFVDRHGNVVVIVEVAIVLVVWETP